MRRGWGGSEIWGGVQGVLQSLACAWKRPEEQRRVPRAEPGRPREINAVSVSPFPDPVLGSGPSRAPPIAP